MLIVGAKRILGLGIYQEMTGRISKQKWDHEGASTFGCKSDGLVKRSFRSNTSSGTRFHLAAYSSQQYLQLYRLCRPTDDP